MAGDNVSLGEFNLMDIPPAPRGVPQIEVTLDIDANGILNVTAKDRGTGKQNKITISASTKLSPEEKERLIREADQFAEQDRKKKEEAEIRNTADSLVYTSERTKQDLAGKIAAEDTAKIDAAVTELKNALAANDMATVKAKSEALQKVLQDIGTKVYQQAAAEAAKQQQAQGQAGPQPGAAEPGPGPETGPTGGDNMGGSGAGPEEVDHGDYKVK
jgi:molecular chaperone DnaK